MQLQQTESKELYKAMKELYLEAFPKYERKPFSLMQKTQAKGLVDMWSIMDEDVFVGMAVTMKDKDLVLLDYFAIKPEFRGKGYGSKVLRMLCEQYEGKRFFLEIESTKVDSDNKEQRLNRKAFYLRNNLKEVGLEANVFGTEMELLSLDAELNFEEYRGMYEHVYGTAKALMIKFIREVK